MLQLHTMGPRTAAPVLGLIMTLLLISCTTGYVSPNHRVLSRQRSLHKRQRGSPCLTMMAAEDEEVPPQPALPMGHGNKNKGDEKITSKSSSKPPFVNGMSSKHGDNNKASSLANKTQRRKMRLQWCDREDVCGDVIRERVNGDHNHMSFSGPATGQVCYTWSDQQDGPLFEEKEKKSVAVSSVLILVRPGDDELMQIAAKAVRELTTEGIQVLLAPDLAAKLKHFFGVDDDMIKLFDPQPVPGFGENLHPSDMLQEDYGSIPASHRHNSYGAPDPDLICTLGGDGLLMYAGMMFPGPVPPIMSISGGSLGFLSPFSREEMVEAIRMSLGYIKGTQDEDEEFDDIVDIDDIDEEGPTGEEEFPLLNEAASTPEQIFWNGYKAFDKGKTTSPPFQFGIGNCICLSMRMRLDCRVINREGIVRARFNVLNEVVIDRGSSPYLAALECFCDDVHLTTVQADGIIFATPTGSTAYSMAAGGSVVHPAVPAILVTPICPHVLSFRSMVFPDHVILRCFVPEDARSDASVAFDGKNRRELQRGESIQIQMSVYPVPTINRVDHSSDWLNSLKNNFSFNTRARQRPL